MTSHLFAFTDCGSPEVLAIIAIFYLKSYTENSKRQEGGCKDESVLEPESYRKTIFILSA